VFRERSARSLSRLGAAVADGTGRESTRATRTKRSSTEEPIPAVFLPSLVAFPVGWTRLLRGRLARVLLECGQSLLRIVLDIARDDREDGDDEDRNPDQEDEYAEKREQFGADESEPHTLVDGPETFRFSGFDHARYVRSSVVSIGLEALDAFLEDVHSPLEIRVLTRRTGTFTDVTTAQKPEDERDHGDRRNDEHEQHE
jgi:hypothetical protein